MRACLGQRLHLAQPGGHPCVVAERHITCQSKGILPAKGQDNGGTQDEKQ